MISMDENLRSLLDDLQGALLEGGYLEDLTDDATVLQKAAETIRLSTWRSLPPPPEGPYD